MEMMKSEYGHDNINCITMKFEWKKYNQTEQIQNSS